MYNKYIPATRAGPRSRYASLPFPWKMCFGSLDDRYILRIRNPFQTEKGDLVCYFWSFVVYHDQPYTRTPTRHTYNIYVMYQSSPRRWAATPQGLRIY